MAADHITFFNRSTGKLEQEDIYGEAPLRFAYQNPAGRAMLELLVKRGRFSRWYGWRMDKPASRAVAKEWMKVSRHGPRTLT